MSRPTVEELYEPWQREAQTEYEATLWLNAADYISQNRHILASGFLEDFHNIRVQLSVIDNKMNRIMAEVEETNRNVKMMQTGVMVLTFFSVALFYVCRA